MLSRHAILAIVLIALSCLLSPSVRAQDRPRPSTPYAPAPEKIVAQIKEEGKERSRVMETLRHLTDVIGPRLTGSPQMTRANEWARDQMDEWGLDSHLEAWGPFGRGWSLSRFAIQAVEPQCIPLIAYPKAWSPGLDGTLSAKVVYYNPKDAEDLKRFEDTLDGAIVLTAEPRATAALFEPPARRLTDADLLGLADADAPEDRPRRRRSGGKGPSDAERDFAKRKQDVLRKSGAALLIDPSSRGDGGTLFVQSASVSRAASTDDKEALGKRPWDKDAPDIIPQVVMAVEHYNRLVRMVEAGETPTLEVELEVAFHDDDPMAYNTIAEIPGTDPELKDEVVMLGGHLDSWHSGTGATDNASGCAVAMEAVRILKALDLKPRRTIRVALWSGEEQGLLGSRAYVKEHFVKNPDLDDNDDDESDENKDDEDDDESDENKGDEDKGQDGDKPRTPPVSARSAGSSRPAPELTPEAERFNVYFNLDNGTGKIRGLYMEGNEAVRPIFRRWFAPFRDLAAGTLTISRTGGTDHMSFNAIGLPGFQFIQDPIEYGTRTHHSNMDVYDRLQADDMTQASILMATLVYNAAMSDAKLPRKETPRPASTESAGAKEKTAEE